jgi:hypothetical protein
MTALLDRIGSDGRTGARLLAVPVHVDVLGLARAWFPDAAWEVEPVSDATAAARVLPLRGARFRGLAAQPEAVPGVLRLTGGHVLTGPHPLTAEDTVTYVLPPRHVDAFVLRASVAEAEPGHPRPGRGGGPVEGRADGPRLPGHAVPDPQDTDRVHAWLVAAARRARGAVVNQSAGPAVVPDSGRSVDRTLFSAHPLAPHHALAIVRTVLVQAVVRSAPLVPEGAPLGWTIATETPYDGTVEVILARVGALPPALQQLPWRDSGPCAYSVRWVSGSPEDQESEHPSPLHLVARARIAPLVARVAAALEQAVEGTLLDEDGFVVEGTAVL